MKTKLQELGFTSGHVHLLLVAVALFSVLFVAKSDISLHTLFANADDQATMVSFEDVMSEVQSQNGTPSTAIDPDAEEQIALLDRSLDQGSVLGEAIGIGAIPSADELYSQEQLSAIPVGAVVGTNQQSIKQYTDAMLRLETTYDTATLYSDLNSSDTEVNKQAANKVTNIVSDMTKISVPDGLLDFHRYNVLYYQSLGAIGNSFVTGEGDLANYSKTFFSLSNKISSIKADIKQKYGAELWHAFQKF